MEIEDECQECKKIGKCGACPVMMNWVKEHRELNDIFEVKKIIKEYYNEASHGLFFNRNNVGNKMINIYNKNEIQIDICYDYGYFEIFGLNSLQKTELTKFYENLKNNIRKWGSKMMEENEERDAFTINNIYFKVSHVKKVVISYDSN